MAITSQSTSTASGDLVAGWLTPLEFGVLEALIDTLLPSLEPPEGASEEIAAYYRRSARNLDVARPNCT